MFLLRLASALAAQNRLLALDDLHVLTNSLVLKGPARWYERNGPLTAFLTGGVDVER